MASNYSKKMYWFIPLIIFLLIFIIGCTNQDTTIEKDATEKTQVSTTAEEYPDAALGGTFSTNDKIEYLDVKGIVVTGKMGY